MREEIRRTVLLLDELAAQTALLPAIRPLSEIKEFLIEKETTGAIPACPRERKNELELLLARLKKAGVADCSCRRMAGLLRRLVFLLVLGSPNVTGNDQSATIREACMQSAVRLRAVKDLEPSFSGLWRGCREEEAEEEKAACRAGLKQLDEQYRHLLLLYRMSLRLDVTRCRAALLQAAEQQAGRLPGSDELLRRQDAVTFEKEDLKKSFSEI